MAEYSTTLNLGTNGDKVAGFLDAGTRVHQEVVIQTQRASADPVSISLDNPIPALVQGMGPSNAAASGNPVLIGGVFHSSPPALSDGQASNILVDATGAIRVNIVAGAAAGGTSSLFGAALPNAGTAMGASDGTNMQPLQVDGAGNLKVDVNAGGVAALADAGSFTEGTTQGLPVVQPYNDGMTDLTSGKAGAARITKKRQLITVQHAAELGGWTASRLTSAATNNATVVKASRGTLCKIVAHNINAAPRFLKFYNKASAPAPATDNALLLLVFPIPGNTAGAGFVIDGAPGWDFSTGIAFAIVANIGDTDNTAIAASEVVLNLGYL